MSFRYFYNVSGQSTIQSAVVHSCPDETVIFTCFGRQAMIMDWIMVPYIPEVDAKSFVMALAVNNRDAFTFTYTDFISSKLTNLTGYENRKADMTIIIITTQKAAIALEPLTTHPDEWAEPSHK